MEDTIVAISNVEFVSYIINAFLLLGMALAIIFAKKLETICPRLLAKSKQISNRAGNTSIGSILSSHAHS